MTALTLNLKPVIQLTDEQFFQLCQVNELSRFERNADGTLLLMPLVGGKMSIRSLGKYWGRHSLTPIFPQC